MDRFGASLEIKTVDSLQRIISGWAAVGSNIDRVRDIIDPRANQKAGARANPSQVAVYIGHQAATTLPMGVPVVIRAEGKGLYTETLVKPGPFGDDLLETARFLQQHGQTLGMSIGYRVRDARPDRVDGKTVRRILDYELIEYSFASSQAIANPEALVTGVKTGGGMYRVKEMDGRFHVMRDDKSLADYATEDEATAKVSALKADDGGKTLPNTLPDSAFLYVQPGGQFDDEGKTVPRSFRHFAYRDADGELDMDALQAAVKSGSSADVPGLDADGQRRLYARARHLVDQLAHGVKTVEDCQSDAALDLLSTAYRLIDAAESVVTEHKALVTLGESTNDGRRMRPETREMVTEAAAAMTRLVERAEMIERGEDGKALTDWWAAQFDLMEVAS